jgi:hypothetical protein
MSDVPPLELPRLFLDEAYKSLGFLEAKDALLNAVSRPEPGTDEEKEWLEKGDWLALASKVEADKVFFVKNDPVIVFCTMQSGSDNEQALVDKFRRIWCMARPQCLFIALPDGLHVYRLDRLPVRDAKSLRKVAEIGLAKSIQEVAEKLHAFRRERIESGYLVNDKYFGGIDQRADKRLIQDLKTVRRELLDTGLEAKYAHALIGRSIFIRYLEDRGIIDEEYLLQRVVKGNLTWQVIFEQETNLPDFAPGSAKRRYHHILSDKAFTYALFRQLMNDFNGDMFPDVEEEEKRVTDTHLTLIQGFLLGNTDKYQRPLFLWAYDFEVIPIELISSIYEEFYHKENIYHPEREKKRKQSKKQDDIKTHYTPSVLVEYVLSNLLPEGRLATRPKILDPACGSGIFLVESFRRIVRYWVQQHNDEMLSAGALRNILREQIRGIEINEEAVHVAAFSLYLALLHYQEPPAIRAQKLPHLIYREGQPEDEDHCHVLFRNNTFAVTIDEREKVNETLNTLQASKKRDKYEKLVSGEVLPLTLHSYDIIVGNPPWGFTQGATQEIREAQERTEAWSEYFNWSIGDREPSQMFIARSLSLIKDDGECGLLVSTGVFLKHRELSKKFRRRWFEETTIKTVVNFAHVRHAFFNMDANAPFAFVHFLAQPASLDHWVHHWTVKKTELVDKTQTVVLGQPDVRQVQQVDLLYNDFLWKVYSWGNHRDANLIKALRVNTTLGELAERKKWPKGLGFKDPSSDPDENDPSDWLLKYDALPTDNFRRYGQIKPDELEPVPIQVHRLGDGQIQTGWRLLIGQGITQKNGANGRVEARLEHLSYCFRSSIFGINVDNADDWERKVLVGIAWSSLARYCYFMTVSSWSTWHHQLHLEEAWSLPIRFPRDVKLRNEIVDVVNILMNWPEDSLFGLYPDIKSIEHRLDRAIFDLYKLGEAERDLILDLCEVNLEFFYRHSRSLAAKSLEKYPLISQGTMKDLPAEREKERGLEGYLYAFLEMWNRELAPRGEFYWRVIRPPSKSMIAVVFTTQEVGDALPPVDSTDDEEWSAVLDRCSETLKQPVSRRIYIDSMLRVVTDTEIYIIKRDERRLWTRSMAREDAEATLVRAMYLQEEAMKETV